MSAKKEIVAKIVSELSKAQHEEWMPPSAGPTKQLHFPPALPLGDGRHLQATEDLLTEIEKYANIFMANDIALKPRFRTQEFEQLLREIFGTVLEKIDLASSEGEQIDQIIASVDQELADLTDRHRREIGLIFGCHLLDGGSAYPIKIGPVTFHDREVWRQQSLQHRNISHTTARRLADCWSGKRLRKRRAGKDQHRENAVIQAVGGCPIICAVITNGLSSKNIQEKGLLAGRLAMTALSLMWEYPSQGLGWMNLKFDGQVFNRTTALFDKGLCIGSSSSISQMPSGRWVDAEFVEKMRSQQWLFDRMGEALLNYVQPVAGVTRPRLMNALFLSLWWFHQACREVSDQMATVKFAASMDALAGGHKAKGIAKLIEARLGFESDQPIMKDGRTTKKIVTDFYDAGRSRLIHGSSDDFANDWSQLREAAENIGRHCLVATCHWLTENPLTDDLNALSVR